MNDSKVYNGNEYVDMSSYGLYANAQSEKEQQIFHSHLYTPRADPLELVAKQLKMRVFQ